MRGDTYVVCPGLSAIDRMPHDSDSLGHGSDLLGLTDTSSMSDIRLNDIDASSLEVRSTVKTCEQTLSELSSQLGLRRRSLYVILTAIGMVVLLYRSFNSFT